MRALLFAVTGVAFFAFWAIERPTYEMTASMTSWPTVLWFSSTLVLLAVAVFAFGWMVGGRWVVRLASIAAVGLAVSSVSNVLEDGFRIEAAFFGFVLGMLTQQVALAALTLVIARTASGRDRLLAVVPAGTVAGILLFVVAGGPLMLATWLIAAGAAVASARRADRRVSAPQG